jgi:hypothetical protein
MNIEMRFDTEEMLAWLSGQNRIFIQTIAKEQKEQYGIDNYFKADGILNDIEIIFGDKEIIAQLHQDVISSVIGSGVGHEYQAQLESCIVELNRNYFELQTPPNEA